MNATRTQIRGSSLLLVGRGLSATINFATQVLIVRYLSTHDFGAFAYVLSIVTFFQAFSTLGLQTAIPRFVPIYHEKREYNKLFGTMALVALVIGSMLLLLAVVARFTPQSLFHFRLEDRQTVALLYIMVFLIPVQALDSLLGSFFVSLTSPRTIFFRTHVLSPSIKLLVAILLIALGSNVTFLAYGYVVGSALGVVICIGVLITILKRKSLLEKFRPSDITMPTRELFSFSLPVLTSELVTGGMMNTIAVFLLAHYYSTTEVAFFRAVVPTAALNMTVMGSFSLLYTPLASRLFARGDYEAINALYWKTTVWMLVLSLPVFLVTFSTATPLTVLLYGARYQASGRVLAVLSLGYFFNIALGLNTQTLRVFGIVRYILIVNLLSVIAGSLATILMIPRFGAIGAAVGTSGTLIVRNIFTHAGLKMGSKIRLFDGKYLRLYLLITATAAGLLVLQTITSENVYLSLTFAVFLSVLVFVLSTDNLELKETFPELLEIEPIRLFYKRYEQIAEFVAARLFKAFDAAMTACANPKGLAGEQWDNYARIAALVNVVSRFLPKLAQRAFAVFCRPWLPFASGDASLLAFGSSATVFLVKCDEADQVVKVYRRSMGRNLAELLEIANLFREKRRFVASWYNGTCRLVPPEEFVILKDPIFGRPVAAAVQPYVQGRKRNLLSDVSDHELIELARLDREFRRQLLFFAEQTIRMHKEEQKCLDFFGRDNVLLVNDAGAASLYVLDNEMCDLRALQLTSPETVVRIDELVGRLQALAEQISVEPQASEDPALLQQSPAAAV